jgi:hypothetical protein
LSIASQRQAHHRTSNTTSPPGHINLKYNIPKKNRKKISSVYIQSRLDILHLMVSGHNNINHSLNWDEDESDSESAVKQLHQERNPVIEIHECTHTCFPDLDFPSHFST